MSELKLVPARMLLDKDTIDAINFHCGGGGGDNFGEHSDGLLWVGTVTDNDGKEVYGLHLATAEYPEEGSTTLVEFGAPEDAAQAELAALREELAQAAHMRTFWAESAAELDRRLTAAEQRNSALAEMLSKGFNCMERSSGNYRITMDFRTGDECFEAYSAICNLCHCDSLVREPQPTESGASE